ncbi:vesicle transport v-SNARE 13-like [Cucumis melo var. makuwa]|uniref:Vesicle transport v-SNARE 13-like n=1 Tax=Cucumis melo var. makuwa TaxID=1194695 RepID=A0A5D3DPX4_CUCMM|nr:vesicle transport v-SNARE 13-like [Cucumis melo var. makuwa]TYK25624.1 vesicle transport v-SNARE 13-like [Cucumis melo var. makuwa]
MSEVFERYERQYCELSANLSRKCTSATALDGEQKKQKLSEIKGGIDEAESLIRKMDLDARSLQPSVKIVLLARLREYKSDLNNLKSEVKRITSGNVNATARDELLESGLADTLNVSADQRTRLMTTTERLGNMSDRIKDSQRTMLETEDLGVSILEDLHSQRQSLLGAHDTVKTLKNNFTVHLYYALKDADINIFQDDLELQRSEDISPELERAIEGLKTGVTAFSERYAESGLCLFG